MTLRRRVIPSSCTAAHKSRPLTFSIKPVAAPGAL
jgi:hypothetical protein